MEGMPEMVFKSRYNRFTTTSGAMISSARELRFDLGNTNTKINASHKSPPGAE
jgi:hypothetical protein